MPVLLCGQRRLPWPVRGSDRRARGGARRDDASQMDAATPACFV